MKRAVLDQDLYTRDWLRVLGVQCYRAAPTTAPASRSGVVPPRRWLASVCRRLSRALAWTAARLEAAGH